MKVSIRALNPRLWKWAIGLSLLGLILSLYSSYEYVHVLAFPFGGEAACNINAKLNCEQAIRSEYAAFFERSLGSWGAMFYSGLLLFLLFCSVDQDEKPKRALSLFLLFSFFSLVASLSLGYISLTTLSALCPVCLALYAISLAIFVIAVLYEKESSTFERIGNGIVSIWKFPLIATRFLVEQCLPKLISLQAPLLIISIALFVGSSLSDSLFYEYLKANENLDVKKVEIFKGWSEKPIQRIPFKANDDFLGDYRKGNLAANIRIVEFFDYECPACRRFYYEMKEIYEDFGEHIIVEYRNYPLDQACNPEIKHPFHLHACESAEFTRCAGEQGKFFEAAEYLLTLEAFDDENNTPTAISAAIRAGISVLNLEKGAMDECLNSDRQIEAIQNDIKVATSLGLRGTPTVWVNDRQVPKLGVLRELVEYLVERETK